MKILELKLYRDGGTVELNTNKGVFCFDGRMNTKTKGALYSGYPQKDNLIENQKELEPKIIEALKEYKDDSQQEFIEYLINSIGKQ